MQKEGFNNVFEVDLEQMLDKEFFAFRRFKSNFNDENKYHKWNPFNLINKHWTRHTDQMYDLLMENDVPKKIFQSRPHIVLNIGNEYITFLLMDKLRGKSRLFC